MGLTPQFQDAGLRWLKGTPFPPPPAELWLSLHRAWPADTTTEVKPRVRIQPGDLGEPRDASRDPLPQDPFIPGDGRLRDMTNLLEISSDLLITEDTLQSFSIWDQEFGGQLVLRGRLQTPVDVFPGDVFVLDPGQLLIRFTSP